MNKKEKDYKQLMPSNKRFGYFFSIIFLGTSIFFYINYSLFLFIFFIMLFLIFLIFSIFFSKYLFLFNYLWFRFGLLLNVIVSPIILGMIFFFLFTPMSLIMKLFGRDELLLKMDNKKLSYWRERKTKYINPKSFEDQF